MSTQQNPNVQLTLSGILFTMLLIASIIGTCILIFTRTGEASGSALNLFAKGNIMPLIATPTPIVSAIPQITPTSEVGGGIVTTATVTPQPTASPTTSDPYLHLYPLAFYDPLTNNNQGHAWDQGANATNARCQFTSTGLEVTQPRSGYFHSCLARSTNFTDFVYEVRMTLITGNYGGILFHVNIDQASYYLFTIKSDGSYSLKSLNHDQNAAALTTGISAAIQSSPQASNLLAIALQSGAIKLYINQHLIATLHDATHPQGAVGVFAGNDGHPTDVIFSNARVWISPKAPA